MPRQRNQQRAIQNQRTFHGGNPTDLSALIGGRRINQWNEEEYRLEILNALLRTPHGDLNPYIEPFRIILERDPIFFSRLAVWYCAHGSVHDLKQLFIALLCISRFSQQLREAGLALLEKLPPFQVERVMHLIKGHDTGSAYRPGLNASIPRSFRTAVQIYLRNREANENSFDSTVLHSREALLSLYCSLRIKPSKYAQRVLFDDEPPESSRLYGLKMLSWTYDSEEQADLILDHRLPYRAAVSAIKFLSPPVIIALVEVMTPQELINNLSSLRSRGVMSNEDLRALVECKLEEAKTDSRVSALKTRQAIKAAGLDGEMQDLVAAVGDAQIKARGTIKRSTALFIDKSASMETAIEVGKQIASILAPVCTNGLYVYAFDTIAYTIKAAGVELSHWEQAFAGINAAGGTSCGIALEAMLKSDLKVEQLIIVTDQEENSQPFLDSVCRRYAKLQGAMPHVVIVNVGDFTSHLEDKLRASEITVDTYTFNGDYYSLPSLIPMLSEGTRADLLMEILQLPLPVRNPAR